MNNLLGAGWGRGMWELLQRQNTGKRDSCACFPPPPPTIPQTQQCVFLSAGGGSVLLHYYWCQLWSLVWITSASLLPCKDTIFSFVITKCLVGNYLENLQIHLGALIVASKMIHALTMITMASENSEFSISILPSTFLSLGGIFGWTLFSFCTKCFNFSLLNGSISSLLYPDFHRF